MAHSPETALAVLESIMDGKSVKAAAEENGVNEKLIYQWASGLRGAPIENFANEYARAMEVRADAMADEILEICDDKSFDVRIEDGRAVIDGDAIQRARLKVDTRKWLMAKMQPKKYGERTEQNITGAIPVKIVDDV